MPGIFIWTQEKTAWQIYYVFIFYRQWNQIINAKEPFYKANEPLFLFWHNRNYSFCGNLCGCGNSVVFLDRFCIQLLLSWGLDGYNLERVFLCLIWWKLVCAGNWSRFTAKLVLYRHWNSHAVSPNVGLWALSPNLNPVCCSFHTLDGNLKILK